MALINPFVATLLSVAVVSLMSLAGVIFLAFSQIKLQRILIILVSFAAGALFGDALIHLIPEAFEQAVVGYEPALLILAGIFLFFILEKIIRWRHCHILEHSHRGQPLALMNIAGESVHNFLDGLLIAASFMASWPLGIATTIAVILHEIPQEIGDFGVLLHAGYSVKKALLLNFLSALTAFGGALIAFLIGGNVGGFTAWVIPLTAGGFIYIAGSDLIPELQHDTNWRSSVKQLSAMILGVALMLLLLLVE